MKVNKAVIPAAGLGTRFLPVTKSMPKEMLPIIDRSVIHFVRQKEPKGLGDAVLCAERHCGNDPFAVLPGDDIMKDHTPARNNWWIFLKKTGLSP